MLGILGGGCGGSSSLPEPPPCVSPSPTPTPGPAQSAAGASFRYIRTMQEGANSLAKSLAAFRSAYPDRKFYRTADFRTDYVAYAGQAACTVKALNALSLAANAPSRTRDFDLAFRAVLTDYAKALTQGSDAVGQRNTSSYRDWWDSMDGLEVRLTETLKSAQN